MSAKFLNRLNPAQRRAASHYEGALLVVAGAGSGKTRTLTFRIANLLLNHRVSPERILAVTFTNKAAKEMSDRLQQLLMEELAAQEYNRSLLDISELEYKKLASKVRHTYLKPYEHYGLWIGTFHSMCCRILRCDIEKYTDPQGRKWRRNFSIFDESDSQSLVKEIIVKKMNLDEKKFDPRAIRSKISSYKNTGLSPAQVAQQAGADYSPYHKVVSEVYAIYQTELISNNALDFDDLIYVPVLLFHQCPEVLNYWHQRFSHILVDEYQDTNRTQYELIRLLATNNQPEFDWSDRSVFVVGDADQSIYSFRGADFTILLEFQHTFGDGLPDDQTKTMIKLEENYRSTANILHVANQLIAHNSQRIPKILRPNRSQGELVQVYCAEDEVDEAEYVVREIRRHCRQIPSAHYGHFAILYRTNAQSRQFEEILVRYNIPHRIVGGIRFYDRKEIKDLLAYLKILVNPNDTVSLLRAIAVPKRGVGSATIDKFRETSEALGVPLWQILSDPHAVKNLAGRSAKGVQSFVSQIQEWMHWRTERSSAEIIQAVMHESGYLRELQEQGTDEALERISNLQELYNAALQFIEETGDTSLEGFLNTAALASNVDEGSAEEEKVMLMTLHTAKGLEFPVVFLVGLEQGLLPSRRSLDDPMSLEEERRLMYVGVTRAQELLYLCYTRERRFYGTRESSEPSQFLYEMPPDYLIGNVPRKRSPSIVKSPIAKTQPAVSNSSEWAVGDRLVHPQHGKGSVIKVITNDGNITLAVRFDRTNSVLHIVSPKTEAIRRLPQAED